MLRDKTRPYRSDCRLGDRPGPKYESPTNRQSDWRTLARLPGLVGVCFGRFWVRDLPFPNAMHLGHPFQWQSTLPWHLGPAAKVRILRFQNLRHSGMTVAFQATFEVFTRVGPDNSLERLTERSVGLVTDRP